MDSDRCLSANQPSNLPLGQTGPPQDLYFKIWEFQWKTEVTFPGLESLGKWHFRLGSWEGQAMVLESWLFMLLSASEISVKPMMTSASI